MKITKGMKLTPEQKAQRAESRARNEQRWLDWFEKEEAKRKALADASRAETDAIIASMKWQAENCLTVLVDLRGAPEIKTALEFFRKNFYTDPGQPPPLEAVAARLLTVALAHPGQLIAWLRALINYRRAEGYDELANADTKIIHGWIAGRQEYRTRAKA